MNKNSPVLQDQRIPIIDILRGWALFSVVVMNYATIYTWNTHSIKIETDALTSLIESISEVILGSKGWTLLAILFGFSFSILLQKISSSGQPTSIFFIKRMLWLFVFAFVNTLFFGGDILNDYAFMGLILLLFYNLNTRTLFILGITILLLTPFLQSFLGRHHLLFTPKNRDLFYEFYDKNTFFDYIKANLIMRYKWMLRLSYSVILHLIQLGCFLIGAALHRSNFFSIINNNPRFLKKIFWVSLSLSIVLFISQILIEKYEWEFNTYYNLFYPEILCIMTFITTGIIWMYNTGKAKSIFSGLQIVGKMTLTNYITQNIIAFFLFINLKVDWPLYQYILIAILVFISQIIFSRWWLKKYNYGLLEWLWRCLSYGKIFSLKK
ncbi:DUF418 domain-containing protein [Chryseobacterium polytrichastri]|uniref:DUF418 domain-containing protein n=1 Tax=Chryseobacterium polytrichastri TaxID=1302687 RepID=A0A1M7KQX8_9FLAO|nr:DUF418 domain-containing protein [Chryseobacterium polytrichastri]SHM67912.1 uncharacterized protein SAMN05444267_10703 [Chryseobacterium polytrichastri]